MAETTTTATTNGTNGKTASTVTSIKKNCVPALVGGLIGLGYLFAGAFLIAKGWKLGSK